MGSHSLLQGIFLTQGLNPGLSHCRQILYLLSHGENPIEPCAWFIPYLLLACLATPQMSASLVVQPSLIFPFPYHCSQTSHNVPDRDPGLSLTLYTFHLYSPMATTGKSQESPWERRYALLFAKVPSTLCCSPGLRKVSGECVQFVQIHRNFNFVYYLHMLYLSFFLKIKKQSLGFPL